MRKFGLEVQLGEKSLGNKIKKHFQNIESVFFQLLYIKSIEKRTY